MRAGVRALPGGRDSPEKPARADHRGGIQADRPGAGVRRHAAAVRPDRRRSDAPSRSRRSGQVRVGPGAECRTDAERYCRRDPQATGRAPDGGTETGRRQPRRAGREHARRVPRRPRILPLDDEDHRRGDRSRDAAADQHDDRTDHLSAPRRHDRAGARAADCALGGVLPHRDRARRRARSNRRRRVRTRTPRPPRPGTHGPVRHQDDRSAALPPGCRPARSTRTVRDGERGAAAASSARGPQRHRRQRVRLHRSPRPDLSERLSADGLRLGEDGFGRPGLSRTPPVRAAAGHRPIRRQVRALRVPPPLRRLARARVPRRPGRRSARTRSAPTSRKTATRSAQVFSFIEGTVV